MDFFQVSPQKTRLSLLIFYRYAIIALCFAIDFVLQYENKAHAINISIFLFALFINTIYLFILPHIKKYRRFMIVQVVCDLLIETCIIYVTGGILSVFVGLYFVSILTSGLLVSLMVSIFCASFATIGISAIVIIYYYSILNHFSLPFIDIPPVVSFPQENDLHFCRAYLFAQAISFYAVAFFSGRLTDIHRKKNILHQEILDHLVDGVLVIDYKNRVAYINLEAKEMLNIPFNENCEGRSVIQLLNSNHHLDLLKGILMQRPLECESNWPKKDKTIPVSITITCVKMKKEAYILILKDISFQKRMEEAIKIANRLSSVNETAKMIAHEIRNPLSSILGASQELSKKHAADDASCLLFDIMIKESRRIDKIVQDFLEMSKLRKPFLQKTSISQILAETSIFIQQRAGNSTLIDTKIESDIVVKADGGHLKQVFYNLGINALEACRDSNMQITISLFRSTANNINCHENVYGLQYPSNCPGVIVSFSDSGKGIEQDYLKKIFEPFFTTKKGGSGIGLAIVQQILESHQATYHIKSNINSGTKFKIFFPTEELSNKDE